MYATYLTSLRNLNVLFMGWNFNNNNIYIYIYIYIYIIISVILQICNYCRIRLKLFFLFFFKLCWPSSIFKAVYCLVRNGKFYPPSLQVAPVSHNSLWHLRINHKTVCINDHNVPLCIFGYCLTVFCRHVSIIPNNKVFIKIFWYSCRVKQYLGAARGTFFTAWHVWSGSHAEKEMSELLVIHMA